MTRGLKDVIRIPIPTTHCGRLPDPAWFTSKFSDRDPAEVWSTEKNSQEAYADAVKAILKDQELIGVDILTDGCLRYSEDNGYILTYGGSEGVLEVGGWWTNSICRIGGLRWVRTKPSDKVTVAESVLSPEVYKQAMTIFPIDSFLPARHGTYWPYYYVAEDELSIGKLASSWVTFFKMSQGYTQRPVKFSCVDASYSLYLLLNGLDKGDTNLFFDLCKVYNQVLRQLADAGCKIIQLDWPLAGAHVVANRTKIGEDIWKNLIEGFNRQVEGVNAQIWMHFCFSQIGAPLRLNMVETIKHLGECKVDVVQIEAASTKGEFLDRELSAWKEYCSDKDFCLGVVTPFNFNSESVEDAANIIRKALRYVPLDKLGVSSDEGFRFNRGVAMDKIRVIVEAAESIRRSVR